MSGLRLNRILGGSQKVRAGKYGKYDLVIFGENHVSDTDLEKEIETVRKIKPDYLLMEGFNDLKPVRLSEAGPFVHLSIKSSLLDNIKDLDGYKSQYTKLSQLYSSIKDNIEKSKSLLKEKGAYDLSPATIEKLSYEEKDRLFDITEQKQNYMSMRNFIKKHPRFEDTLDVPIAELPNAYIKALLNYSLRDYRRENGLDEQLLYLLNTASRSDISGETNHIPLLTEAYKNNNDVLIAGIDLNHSEKFTSDIRRREEEMGSLLAKYANEAKQYSKKAFAVVGSAHVMNGSPIFKYLEKAGISYKVLRPNSSYSMARAVVYATYMSAMSSDIYKEKENK